MTQEENWRNFFIADETSGEGTESYASAVNSDTAYAQPNGWFDIKRIVRSRQVEGKRFYLVHWKNSWVEHNDISQEALSTFHRHKRRRN